LNISVCCYKRLSNLNKCCSFCLFIDQRIQKKVSQVKKNIYIKQLFPTLIMIHHIRVISEGSCDTEDWSNDEEIVFKNYIQLENQYFKL